MVEHGTVVTRAIANILEKLKSKKIVTCRGAIGCGKTTALAYVAKKYRDDGWTIKWMEELVDESHFNNLLERDMEKLLLCCDNLFGTFGCRVFSVKEFDRFHHFMKRFLNLDENIKVLLGIHEHVIEEISPKHSLVSQDYNAFVELDSLSRSEALLIYMMQQEKANIKQEYIPFDDFLELVENRSDIVGTPFQTLMISVAPDVFGTKAFFNQSFQQLTEHFTGLYYRNEEIFYSLLYIMCVMIFDTNEGELERSIANAIYPRLDKNTVEMNLNVPDLSSYLQIDGACVKTKHDVISIALFHTFMMESKKSGSIFSACNIRGILELIRPDYPHEKLHPFAVPLSKKTLHKVKTILTKIDHDKVDIRGHPFSEHFSEH